MSCPQIWYIGKEKDRGKEKEGGRKAKLNKKKGDRDLGQEIKKKQRRHFLVGRTTRKFCSRGDKMRNASSHQCKVKMRGSEKKGSTTTHTTFLPKNARLEIISGEPSDTMTGQIHFNSVTCRFWPVKFMR